MDFIYQAFGYIGLILVIISFQMKKRSGIIFLQTVSSVFYFLHFFFLGALTGAYLNLLGIARGYVFYKRDNAKWADNVLWPVLVILLFVISGILTYKSPISILPLVSVILGTLATWSRSEKNIRITFLISRPCWFIYNYVSGSVPGMITEIVLAISIIIGMIRHDKINAKKEDDGGKYENSYQELKRSS